MNNTRLSFFGIPSASAFGNYDNVKPPYSGGMQPAAPATAFNDKRKYNNKQPSSRFQFNNNFENNIPKIPKMPNIPKTQFNVNSNENVGVKFAYNPNNNNNLSFNNNNNNLFNSNIPLSNLNANIPFNNLNANIPLNNLNANIPFNNLNANVPLNNLNMPYTPLKKINGWNMYGSTQPTCCWNNFGGTNYMTTCSSGYCMNQFNGGFSRYVKTNTFAFY